ncbi:alpha-glucan family phosphorylase [Candidatus Dojkabacteria bacterium]|uniref:glycogen phosphorylase n=1 Tax=Candidatus Dojkabacteria bacterium TaxID=2099670 RepID=A0A955L111_9BACT|nr:alpha-glucan family phosphorylase [Candidatus Dojkabacteria bacterium]
MEIGLKNEIKEYAGGLGILAGDTLKTAADMGVDIVGVSILYKNGYFKQQLAEDGEQIEAADSWDYENLLQNTGVKVSVPINNDTLHIEIWKYEITGITGKINPVYFLNTDIEENSQENRYISFNLYTPYNNTRIRQEIALGIGGVMALKAMGHPTFDVYHLNESHAAFAIAALRDMLGSKEDAKKHVCFTTHTPAEHGHIIHSRSEIESILSPEYSSLLVEDYENDSLHLTKFSLLNSKFHNAVSEKHSEVSSKMFDMPIPGITNGIHVSSWASKHFQKLFDEKISTWRNYPEDLQKAEGILGDLVINAHDESKNELINYVESNNLGHLKLDIFTIGFARRVDGYKRSGFLFYELDRLKAIAEKFGGLQVIFSGKAYFDYADGEDHIAYVIKLSKEDLGKLKIIYLPNYDMNISAMMVSGTDIWLNNPIKPLEASGTSGMKAALNGVPNLSTLDGWWVEGIREGITGWAIGNEEDNNEEAELNDMYSKLEEIIIPTYQNNKREWARLMKSAIAYNASHFNTHRMLSEYINKGYNMSLE